MLHVLCDFNFRLVDWNTNTNKITGKPLAECEGQHLINVLNEQGAEQLVSFPTRNENTLDLLISTAPNQFSNICSQDSLSDHEIVSAELNYHRTHRKLPKRKYFQYTKGDGSLRHDAK